MPKSYQQLQALGIIIGIVFLVDLAIRIGMSGFLSSSTLSTGALNNCAMCDCPMTTVGETSTDNYPSTTVGETSTDNYPSTTYQYISKCIILSVEGVNPDGSFHKSVDTIVRRYRPRTYKQISRIRVQSQSSSGQELIENIDTQIANLNDNSDPNEKILVVAHSLGAIAAYSVKIDSGSNTDVDYLLFDPPYNAPGASLANLGAFLQPFFTNIENGVLISDMKNRGLNGQTEGVTDWTNGLDGEQNPGTTLTDEQLHVKFLSDISSLSSIDAWIQQNCKA